MDDVQLSVVIILSGLFVVFLALIILTFVVWIFGKAISSIQNRKNGSRKNDSGEDKAGTVAVKSANVQAAAVADNGSVPAEIVAVISAAVASMLGSAGGFVLKSVTRSKRSRNLWNLAGLQEETRPF